MKIALTVKGSGLGAWLDDDFAHCGHVMVVDDDNRFSSWPNPYQSEDEVQHLQLAEKIIQEKIDCLVTGQISEKVIEKFAQAKIKILEKSGGTVFDLLEEARNTQKSL